MAGKQHSPPGAVYSAPRRGGAHHGELTTGICRYRLVPRLVLFNRVIVIVFEKRRVVSGAFCRSTRRAACSVQPVIRHYFSRRAGWSDRLRRS